MRVCCLLGLLFAFADSAEAAWTAMAFLGGTATAAASLRLAGASPAEPHLETPPVHFDSKSFTPPPYYGYRLGWNASRGGLGIEAELIHMKVYARAADLPAPIERFSISHGLNLLLGNIVWRQRGRGRVRLAARVGAGIAIPHGESRIGGVEREQYEISSLALQGAAGPEIVVAPHARVFAEYKLTTAAPAVSVAGGTIRGRYTTQHLATGLAFTW